MWAGIFGAILGAILGPRLGVGALLGAVIGAATLWAMTHNSTPGAGGGIGGFVTAVGNEFRRAFGFGIELIFGGAVFLTLLMLLARATSVSPAKVWDALMNLGGPWNWPSNLALPLIMFVCGLLLIAGVAILATRGRWKPAVIMIGISFVVIFTTVHMPSTATAIAPQPIKRMPATATQWERTDQAVAESGVIPIGTTSGWRFLFGHTVERAASTVWGGTKKAVRSVLPARSAASSPAASAPTPAPAPAPAPAGLALYPHTFDASGCYETNLGYRAYWYAQGGPMRVTRPDGSEYVQTPGVKSPISHFGPGKWKFCKEGSFGATGVDIWK